jgi:hypothetical protein
MVCHNQNQCLQRGSRSICCLDLDVGEAATQDDLSADASLPNYGSFSLPIRQLVSPFIHADSGKLKSQTNFGL